MGCNGSKASSMADELAKLARLHDEGQLTDAEFAASKQRILGAQESLPLAASPAASLVGLYECHQYDGGGKNDWHYVTISEEAPGRFNWRNRAGVSWSLTWDPFAAWDSYETGDICCGPGSYYLDNPAITVRHEDVTTLEAARLHVEAACRESPDNPVVLWQLSNPSGGPSEAPQHLVYHRQKFLEQNLDADSGKPIDSGFARSVSNFGNGRRWGSPMFFRRPVCTVGTDCPYHKNGHTHMAILRGTDGECIVAVLGPWGERYDREGVGGVVQQEEQAPPPIVHKGGIGAGARAGAGAGAGAGLGVTGGVGVGQEKIGGQALAPPPRLLALHCMQLEWLAAPATRTAQDYTSVRQSVTQHGQTATLGSAPARPLRLLSVRLAAPGSSAHPERGPATGRPATASGAQASRLQSRRFHWLGPSRSPRAGCSTSAAGQRRRRRSATSCRTRSRRRRGSRSRERMPSAATRPTARNR